MAKQKRNINPISRKHVARIEREQFQRRIITISAIAIGVIVVFITAFGLIKEGLIDPQKPVVTVGDDEVSLAEFQAWARYQRFNMVNQYSSYYQYMQSFTDENTRALFENNLRQIQFQLEPTFLGATVIEEIVADLLIRQEAERLGITVTDDEIDTFIAENYFTYYPEGTPTPSPTEETYPTSTLSPEQLALVPPTATPTETSEEPVDAAGTETEETTSGETGAEGTDAEVTDAEVTEAEETEIEEAEPTATVALPTATVFTEEAYLAQLSNFYDTLQTYAKISESELRELIEGDIFRTKVVAALTADLETEEEQIWVRHILVATEEEVQELLERLDAGEDFAELAKELSTDTGSGALGGDLGWFGTGQMVEAFEEAAFDLTEIGEISEPVESGYGFHVIQLLGREMRPISSSREEQLRQQIFEEWLTEQRENPDIVISDNWQNDVPTEPAIPPQILLP